MHLGLIILQQTDNLSKSLQATMLSAGNVSPLADAVVHYLQSIRSDDEFEKLYTSVLVTKEKHGMFKKQIQQNLPSKFDVLISDGWCHICLLHQLALHLTTWYLQMFRILFFLVHGSYRCALMKAAVAHTAIRKSRESSINSYIFQL
jgi:hypothetical protein